jgi:hypothetical protein
MRKEQLFGVVTIGSLAFLQGCEPSSLERFVPTESFPQLQESSLKSEALEPTPSSTLTPTLSPTPTPTRERGFLSGALICPEESQELELPGVGEVVNFQGMDWKVVGVDEFDSDRCEDGIQIILQLCPCEGETPTATTVFFKSSPTPTEKKEVLPSKTPTLTPKPPTETPVDTPVPTDTPIPPTDTPVPTATIPPTITPQPPESTPTASS